MAEIPHGLIDRNPQKHNGIVISAASYSELPASKIHSNGNFLNIDSFPIKGDGVVQKYHAIN